MWSLEILINRRLRAYLGRCSKLYWSTGLPIGEPIEQISSRQVNVYFYYASFTVGTNIVCVTEPGTRVLKVVLVIQL